MTLKQLRRQIDRIDLQLLQLLNKRADYVLRIGELKKREGRPIFDGQREAEVLGRLKRANEGPLPAGSVQEIFRAVLQHSRRLEMSVKKRTRE